MKRDIRIRPLARRDLAGIWSYSKRQWSIEQAERYLTAINSEIERLRERPELGRPVSNVQLPFFKRASGSHVIFYLMSETRLDVVRVLHSRMDFVAHLADNDS